ncbi:MAG: hypothetical protein VX768_20835 [Planctomycetota bacterium]|nr:hypothetical protein [Planctomycetota bacterium]
MSDATMPKSLFGTAFKHSFSCSLIAFFLAAGSLSPGYPGNASLTADDSEKKSAGEKKKKSNSERFVRILKDKKGKAVALQTSSTRYTRKDGADELYIDLIGVVHIGEKSYYKQLNKQFEQYDALLYELVAPEGTRVVKGQKRGGFNPIGGLQNGMKSVLGLEFQLDHIEYSRKNFVHADMSPKEMSDSMTKNDESVTKMFFKMLGSSMAMQGSSSGMSDIALMRALLSGDKKQLRRVMASQMNNLDQAMVMFNGKDGSTIITHRNTKCFQVMDREIQKGKRKIGVFYGAGHLPDMEKRLLGEKYKMKAGSQKWYTAWDLK